MIKELVRLANHLDSKGHRKEADDLDRIIKMAEEGATAELTDALISSELVDLVATYPDESVEDQDAMCLGLDHASSVLCGDLEDDDREEQQRLRGILHGPRYLNKMPLPTTPNAMRELHKGLRIDPAFQYILTGADTDEAEIERMNVALHEANPAVSDVAQQFAEYPKGEGPSLP
jgi:hypothetical protein